MDDFDFEGPTKRPRGRPANGEGVKSGARIPRELDNRVRAFAADNFVSYADAIRQLLERGLNGPKK